jgi:hypothetical protein
MTVEELIGRLREFPGNWQVYATRAGGSVEVWDPEGPDYAYVFTHDRETKRLQRRRPQQQVMIDRDRKGDG